MHRMAWGAIPLCLCLCLSLPLSAQKYSGSIRGVVTDPTGAVIAGAQVTATNTGTGQSVTQTTNASGEYVLPELAPGTYSVQVKHPNFKEFIAKDVQLFVS